MRHATIQQLSAFVDGALTGVSKELVSRHLASCSSCRERHALWRIYDEVLRRVLAWEPDERLLEECSSRVELALTAERKGLPAPEFTSLFPPEPAAPGPVPPPQAKPADSTPAAPTAAGPRAPIAPEPVLAHLAATATSSAPSPSPKSAPVRVETKSVTRPWLELAETWKTKHTRPARRPGRKLVALLAVLLLAVLSTPFLPDVIRIPVPERWLPRLPRIEFVRQGSQPESAPAATRAATQLAEHAPAVDAPVPKVTPRGSPPAHAEITRAPASERVEPAERPEPAASGVPREKPAAPDSEPVRYADDHPVTLVSERIRTDVSLASGAPGDSAPAQNALAPDTTTNPDWPLLCGEVLSEAGVPLEGARVALTTPALTVRTDRKGHFCVACPPGRRTLRIEAAGHDPVTRAVDLGTAMIEVRITLSAAP